MPSLPIRALLLLMAAASLSACEGLPEPPPGWEGDFNAHGAIQRARASLGGTELPQALGETEDLIASVAVIRPDLQGAELSMMIKWRHGGDWSIEASGGPEGPARFAGSGNGGVEVRGGRVVREVSAEEVGIQQFLRCIFVLDFFESGPGGPAGIERVQERSDGGHYVLLSKYDERGLKWTLYLDAASGRPERLREWIRLSEEEGRPLDTLFQSFALDRRGHPYPNVLRTYAGRTLVQEMHIRDIDWNQGLRDADFRP